jgi:hypothetical protein
MGRRFRVGDIVFHPRHPNILYRIDSLGRTDYVMKLPTTWVYLPYTLEDNYRLIDDMVIDRVLTKYNEQ